MTSRDGYNRNRPTRGSSQQPRESQRQGAAWELDADELDRYMSGQPSREPRFDPYGRSQTSGRTERPQPPRQQPQRRQPAQPDYVDFEDEAPQQDGQWVDDDYGYEDDLGYDEFQPESDMDMDPGPAPVAQLRREPRQPARRQRQYEAEYVDDLYEDPYVSDEEEAPRRPQRRQQRPAGRSRQARQAPGFTLPPAIAEAPFVKDQTVLALLGAVVVSLLAMLIVVTTQRDGLGESIFTHVNANGEPANIQTADAIWNLPLIAGMVALISTILAWFLARWGEFLPRFLLGGTVAVHFVVWVAVIAYLF